MRFFLGILFVLGTLLVQGQSPSQLAKKRQALKEEIEKTTRLLRSTQRTKAAAVSDLRTLQVQISNREELLEVLRSETALLQESILRKQSMVEALGKDLERLKAYYHDLLRQLHRYSHTENTWLFVWSAPSLNQAYERWQYLKRLEDHRKQQVNYIKSTRSALQEQQEVLQQRLTERQFLLDLEQSERQSLGQALQQKGQVLRQLKTKESSLRQNLTQKEQAQEHLRTTIDDVVRSEMSLDQARAARHPAKAEKKPKPSPSPPKAQPAPKAAPAAPTEAKPLAEKDKMAQHEAWGSSFRAARGRMPNPIQDGVIVGKFGREQHPVFRTVETVNNGVDIRGSSGSPVRAVHAGEVVSVFNIPGMGKAVMLKHGPYFTTYSNLNTVQVRRGLQVKAQQALGDLRIDPETGAAILHFELWKGRTKYDPAYWLR